jgi:hypothetical protein
MKQQIMTKQPGGTNTNDLDCERRLIEVKVLFLVHERREPARVGENGGEKHDSPAKGLGVN